MPTYPLPKHIAYSQSLASYVEFNLSDSTAQALTVTELFQLAKCELGDIGDTLLQYSPVQGDIALRQAVVDFHQALNCHQQQLNSSQIEFHCPLSFAKAIRRRSRLANTAEDGSVYLQYYPTTMVLLVPLELQCFSLQYSYLHYHNII